MSATRLTEPVKKELDWEKWRLEVQQLLRNIISESGGEVAAADKESSYVEEEEPRNSKSTEVNGMQKTEELELPHVEGPRSYSLESHESGWDVQRSTALMNEHFDSFESHVREGEVQLDPLEFMPLPHNLKPTKVGGGNIDHGQVIKSMELEQKQLKGNEYLSHARPNASLRELTVILPILAYCCVPLWMFIWYPKPRIKMKQDGSIYKRKYLLGTSIGHLVITKEMVDVAKEVAADVGRQGCMRNRDDQVHSELTLFDLNWELMVLVPWGKCVLAGREDAVEYAKRDQVSVPKKSIYSRDRNLWHLSHGRDILEDPANDPKEDRFMTSIELPPVFLLTWLNEIGGNHGIDRVHMDEKVVVSLLMELIMAPWAVKIKFLASLANRVFDGGGMDRVIYIDPPLGYALLTITPSLECSLYECAIMQRYNLSLVDASWEYAAVITERFPWFIADNEP